LCLDISKSIGSYSISLFRFIIVKLGLRPRLSALSNTGKSSYLHFFSYLGGTGAEPDDPYPSLSEFHDYEPNLEFDDSEIVATVSGGKF